MFNTKLVWVDTGQMLTIILPLKLPWNE